MYSTTSTASAKVVTTRNTKGHFVPGYVGTMIRLAEEKQARIAAADANQANRQWLADHGLSHLNPSEIFAV